MYNVSIRLISVHWPILLMYDLSLETSKKRFLCLCFEPIRLISVSYFQLSESNNKNVAKGLVNSAVAKHSFRIFFQGQIYSLYFFGNFVQFLVFFS